MVKKRQGAGLHSEFEGGLLPNLNPAVSGQPTPEAADAVTPSFKSPSTQIAKSTNPQKGADRKKFCVYISSDQADLIDELLTTLKKAGLPRDNSMLMRGILTLVQQHHQHDPEWIKALTEVCGETLPIR